MKDDCRDCKFDPTFKEMLNADIWCKHPNAANLTENKNGRCSGRKSPFRQSIDCETPFSLTVKVEGL